MIYRVTTDYVLNIMVVACVSVFGEHIVYLIGEYVDKRPTIVCEPVYGLK